MAWIQLVAGQLWQHAWVVIPLALLAAFAGRALRCGPVTRHGIWVIVLFWFLLPPLLPPAPTARWLQELDRWTTPADSAAASSPALAAEPPEALWSVSTEAPTDSYVATPLPNAGRPAPYPVRTLVERPTVKHLRLSPLRNAPVRVMPPIESLAPPPETAWCPDSELPQIALIDDPAPPAQVSWPQPASDDVPRSNPVPPAWWRSWLVCAAVVRTALTRLPPVPTELWIGGAALLVTWNALGMVVFLRRMRRGGRPPDWVVAEVREVARQLGLRWLPATRMVAARVSPMIWCGWKPTLILPVGLWRRLDPVGRRAVLCHELAHLRRHDHWIHRLDLLVKILFWWHPVSWWVRRRVHEEADYCCDAWVTWLMPQDRRAYAEALLKTRLFLGNTSRAVPVAGTAVITPGARRLARRLTMVMTQTSRPRQSFQGLVMVVGVIGL